MGCFPSFRNLGGDTVSLCNRVSDNVSWARDGLAGGLSKTGRFASNGLNWLVKLVTPPVLTNRSATTSPLEAPESSSGSVQWVTGEELLYGSSPHGAEISGSPLIVNSDSKPASSITEEHEAEEFIPKLCARVVYKSKEWETTVTRDALAVQSAYT